MWLLWGVGGFGQIHNRTGSGNRAAERYAVPTQASKNRNKAAQSENLREQTIDLHHYHPFIVFELLRFGEIGTTEFGENITGVRIQMRWSHLELLLNTTLDDGRDLFTLLRLSASLRF
jgi:hypothetical protein